MPGHVAGFLFGLKRALLGWLSNAGRSASALLGFGLTGPFGCLPAAAAQDNLCAFALADPGGSGTFQAFTFWRARSRSDRKAERPPAAAPGAESGGKRRRGPDVRMHVRKNRM
jgi:hypothetical protein